MHLTYIRYILNQITVGSTALQSQSLCCVDNGDKYGLLRLNILLRPRQIYIYLRSVQRDCDSRGNTTTKDRIKRFFLRYALRLVYKHHE